MEPKRAIKIVVTQQKGGVGKTTTVLALASAFSRMGRRVMVVDLDFQGNATHNLGLDVQAIEQRRTITEAIQRSLTAADIILPTHDPNVSLLAADISLDLEVAKHFGTSRQFSLVRKILACPEIDNWDLLLFDSHPTVSDPLLGGALAVADFLLTPSFAEANSYIGLAHLTATVNQIREDLNPRLQPLGLVITSVKPRNATHRDFEQRIRELQDATKTHVFSSVIPYSDAVTAAAAAQRSIVDYRPDLPVSQAYSALAVEVLERIKQLQHEAGGTQPGFQSQTF